MAATKVLYTQLDDLTTSTSIEIYAADRVADMAKFVREFPELSYRQRVVYEGRPFYPARSTAARALWGRATDRNATTDPVIEKTRALISEMPGDTPHAGGYTATMMVDALALQLADEREWPEVDDFTRYALLDDWIKDLRGTDEQMGLVERNWRYMCHRAEIPHDETDAIAEPPFVKHFFEMVPAEPQMGPDPELEFGILPLFG